MRTVRMPRKDYIAEHRKLIAVLRSGNKKKLLNEYKIQSKELNLYLRRTK